MAVCAEFHFDFGSPNAYLAHKMIPEIMARTDVNFSYSPVLLGSVFKATNNAFQMLHFLPATRISLLTLSPLCAAPWRPTIYKHGDIHVGKDRLADVEQAIIAVKR